MNFLKKTIAGNYFDLKGSVIKNTEPYYDGLFGNSDLVRKAYVDSENGKQDIAFADKANNDDALLNDASGNLDVKDHTITGMRLRHKKIQL